MGKREGLPREKRLSERAQFLKFFSNGQVARLGAVEIFRIQNTENFHRLGITIKTAAKNRLSSVVRTGIKRTIREIFRKKISILIGETKESGNLNLPSGTGYDFNFVVAPPKRKSPTPWGTKEWLEQFKREIDLIEWRTVEFLAVTTKKRPREKR